MDFIRFTVLGEPTGKGRPRFSRGHTYTPQKTVDYEEKVKLSFLESKCPRFHDEPLRLMIRAYFPIPKSASKIKRRQMILGQILPTKKPDFDNITKVCGDSLNGLAYNDDCQIISCYFEKFYGETPRVEVEIYAAV